VVFHIRARKGRKELHELTLPLDFASERLLNCRLALLHWIPRVTIGGALAKRRPSRKRKRAIAVFAIWLSSGDPPTVGSSPVRSNVSMEYTGVLGVECNIQCQYCYQNPPRGRAVWVRFLCTSRSFPTERIPIRPNAKRTIVLEPSGTTARGLM
jgi:sulfatase maturation enzyme AslB (radical SAM superfamily)